jgi:hypothetical protein
MRRLHCPETSGIDYLVTRRHIAEKQKFLVRRCEKKKKQAKLAWFTKANAFVNGGTATSKFSFSLVCLVSEYFLQALSDLPLHLECLLTCS